MYVNVCSLNMSLDINIFKRLQKHNLIDTFVLFMTINTVFDDDIFFCFVFVFLHFFHS
jgi:hypothetical protein